MNVKDRDFRSWNITPEEADRIAQGDSKAAFAFFEAHKSRLIALARNYAFNHNISRESIVYSPEDMLPQLLVDLPYLNWTNSYTLTLDIKHKSFAWSAYGGYSYRVEAGLPHSRSPWEYIDETTALESPMFESDEDGKSRLDVYVADEESDPFNILVRAEGRQSYEAQDIIEKLRDLLSVREAEYLLLYLDGYSFADISEKMGVKDCSAIQAQTHSKLVRRYKEVLQRVFREDTLPHRFKDVKPDDFETVRQAYENRIAAKRKTGNPKRTFVSDQEREEADKAAKRAWYERNKELQNERRRQRRQAARAAKMAHNGILTPAVCEAAGSGANTAAAV